MRKTKAQYLYGKFEKLERGLKAQGLDNPTWLNNVLDVLNRHTNLDTMIQCSDALHAEYDSASYGNLADCMIKANDMWKEARVHPMFSK